MQAGIAVRKYEVWVKESFKLRALCKVEQDLFGLIVAILRLRAGTFLNGRLLWCGKKLMKGLGNWDTKRGPFQGCNEVTGTSE